MIFENIEVIACQIRYTSSNEYKILKHYEQILNHIITLYQSGVDLAW